MIRGNWTRFARFRPNGIAFCILAVALHVAPRTDALQDAGSRLPNVILIVADDLGYGELGCYGQRLIQTPNIDRMARDGIRFTQFYCGQAVCAPSRCTLMTGLHQGHTSIRDNGNPPDRGEARPEDLYFPGQFPIPDETVTVAELLKGQGYATAAIGKWGLGPVGSSGDPNRQGFDLFYGYNCQVHAHNHYPRFHWRNDQQETLPGNDRTMYGETYSQDRFADEALRFVRENRDRPFFLYLPFAIPHLAIQVPDASLTEFRGDIVEEDYRHRGYLPFPEPRAGYAAMISHMDRDIGDLLDLLAETGLDENTLVIFTSDNGPTYDRLGGTDSDYFQSTGPLRGRKGSLLEGGIRVPLVARWPGRIQTGSESAHVAAFQDFLPTFCDIAGTGIPEAIDGISMLAALTGEGEQAGHSFLYWEFPGYGGQQAVRIGDWKAIRQGLHKNPRAPFELYNLAEDVGEARDVAKENPEVVRRIGKICRDEHQPSELFPFPAID